MRLPFKNGEMDLRPTKILCLLQNYRDHAAEMGSQAPEEPVFFLKPPSSMLPDGGRVLLPKWSSDVQHEVELAVIIGRRTKDATVEGAMGSVMGYAVAMDLTARDVQSEAKKRGRPWAIAKGFDTSLPIGPGVVPAGDIDPHDLKISLRVNGSTRQSSSTKYMIHDVEHVISYSSGRMTLEPMDLILTGTPSGVGRLAPGDVVEAEIEGIGVLKVDVSG